MPARCRHWARALVRIKAWQERRDDASEVASVLLFGRLPPPAARLACRSSVPFARTGFAVELPKSISPVERHLDHALVRDRSRNVGRTGYCAVLNSQTKLGRRVTASGFRFDGDIPDAVIRRPGVGMPASRINNRDVTAGRTGTTWIVILFMLQRVDVRLQQSIKKAAGIYALRLPGSKIDCL
jgi:hypothetical protein